MNSDLLLCLLIARAMNPGPLCRVHVWRDGQWVATDEHYEQPNAVGCKAGDLRMGFEIDRATGMACNFRFLGKAREGERDMFAPGAWRGLPFDRADIVWPTADWPVDEFGRGVSDMEYHQLLVAPTPTQAAA